MSPRGLVALLLVGLCTAQMASAAVRHSREEQQLLDHAQEKLQAELATKHDAALSSVETVKGFIKQMEADVIKAGNEKLAALGFPLDLNTLSELTRSNAHSCFTTESFKNTTDHVMNEVLSCVSKDVNSLKGVLADMYGLWGTAKALPGSMDKVAHQCSEHANKDIPAVPLTPPPKDESNHDLAPGANAIAEQAAATRSKRFLWRLSRVKTCVKSVYSLAKNDLSGIPGQMVSMAANAFRTFKGAQKSKQIPKCVQERTTAVMPALKALSTETAYCLASVDIDELLARNPQLSGVKSMLDMSRNFQKNGGIYSATAAVGAAKDLYNSGLVGSAASAVVGKLWG